MGEKLFALLLSLCLGLPSFAESPAPRGKALRENLKAYLSYLASDALRGRNTGTPEAQKAAEYIANKFDEFNLQKGLQPQASYLQTFQLVSSPLAASGKLKIGESGETIYNYSDIITLTSQRLSHCTYRPYLGSIDSLQNRASYAQVVNAVSVYQGLQRIGELSQTRGGTTFMLVVPTKSFMEFNAHRTALSSTMVASANSAGDTVLTAMFSAPTLLKENTFYATVLPFLAQNPHLTIFVADDFFIKKMFDKAQLDGFTANATPTVGKTLAIEGAIQPDRMERTPTSNVIGVVSGSKYADEAIVVSAHYDHIGVMAHIPTGGANQDSICNGADDNASGTAAIIEMARLFGDIKAKNPKRTVIFAAFTGEEEGLLGSQFLADNPIVPLKNIKAVVNLDMVGRTNSQHTEKDMYVYTLALVDSLLFARPIASSAQKVGITIPQTIPSRERLLWTMGSDHYSFVKKNIPALVLTTGEHPDYHTPADEVAKINFDRLTKITDFAYNTVWELANPK